MMQPRNLIIVGENAHVQIIERHQSLSNNAVFTNSVTEIFAEKRAYLDFYKRTLHPQSLNFGPAFFAANHNRVIVFEHPRSLRTKGSQQRHWVHGLADLRGFLLSWQTLGLHRWPS